MAYRHLLILYGTIIAVSHKTVPTGYLLCNGSAVSRTTYADLYKAIGSTYGSGNGSSTFNLPNLVGKFLEGNSSAGTSKAAGLPNITGSPGIITGSTSEYNGAGTGAFYCENHGSKAWADDVYISVRVPNLDASRSNSIYGASTTVQPPAVTTLFCIKY